MHTSKNPCFLRWQWTVLCHNGETFLAGLGRVAYERQARGKTRGDWRNCGRHARGREQERVPLRGGVQSGCIGDESVWLDFGETVFEQHGGGERGFALRQSRGG